VCRANRVVVFCHTSPVATDSLTDTASQVPDTDGYSRPVTTGLWQWRAAMLVGLPAGLPTLYADYSRYWMRLHGWSFSYVALITSLTLLSIYIGCTSSLRSLCWRIKFFMGLHCVTWVRSSMYPIYLVGVVSVLPALTVWSFHHLN